MFWTIIKQIYEECLKKGFSEEESKTKACYNSVEIKRNWSQEQINKFIYWDCSGIQTLLTNKREVSYIKRHERKLNENFYIIRAHFRLKKDEKISYSRSDDKHITAQHILSALIMQKEKIKINYRDIPFYINDINLILKNKTTEHILEQTRIEEEFGIKRRADLLFELETPNLTFGKGFIFEIINNESIESIKEKSMDWAKIGYTLIAVKISNFDFENFGLKKEPMFILYRLFDDLNLYLEILKKIKENEPLIDNYNKNVREMERKMFLYKSGKHNYKIKDNEKVKSIMLFCIGSSIKKFKNKEKIVLNCYDFNNFLINLDIWDSNWLFKKLKNDSYSQKLIKVKSAYFKEYLGEVSLVFNNYSQIEKININEVSQDDN